MEITLTLKDNDTEKIYSGEVYISLCSNASNCFTSTRDEYNFSILLEEKENSIYKSIYFCGEDCILKFSVYPTITKENMEINDQAHFLR